jgi:hypothetical protein
MFTLIGQMSESLRLVPFNEQKLATGMSIAIVLLSEERLHCADPEPRPPMTIGKLHRNTPLKT